MRKLGLTSVGAGMLEMLSISLRSLRCLIQEARKLLGGRTLNSYLRKLSIHWMQSYCLRISSSSEIRQLSLRREMYCRSFSASWNIWVSSAWICDVVRLISLTFASTTASSSQNWSLRFQRLGSISLILVVICAKQSDIFSSSCAAMGPSECVPQILQLMHMLWLHSLQKSSFLFCLWLRQYPKLRMGFSLRGLRSCLLEILSLWCQKSHFLQKQVFSVRQQCVATTSEHFWQIIFLNFYQCTFVKENWIRQQGSVCILCFIRKRWRYTYWSSSGYLKYSESNPSGIGQSSCRVYSLATTGNDFLGQILTTSSSCSCFSEGTMPSICPVWKIMPLWPGRLLNSKPFWQTRSMRLEPVSDSGLIQASEMMQPLFSFQNWLLRYGLITEYTRFNYSEALPRFSCNLYSMEFHSAFQGQICWYFSRQFFCRFSI